MNKIWLAAVISIIVVLSFGYYTFRNIRTPTDRPWDYGTVPFVPSKSHYSSHNPPVPYVPPPASTRPDPGGER